MTLTTLRATEADFGSEAAFMRSELSRYTAEFDAVDADEITSMFLEAARLDLANDLPGIVRQPAGWRGYNDSIGRTAEVPAWRRLLSRKQLELFYRWLGGAEGDLNDRLRRQYAAEYRSALAVMPSVIRGEGGTTVTQSVTIRL